MQLKDLKGLGPKRLALLEQYHIKTPEDLLHFYPVDYLDNSVLTPAAELEDGMTASVCLKLTAGPSFFSRGGLNIITFYGVDEAGKKLAVRYYNQPFRAKTLSVGKTCIFSGRVLKKPKQPVALMNPAVYESLQGIIPVYRRIPGLPAAALKQWIRCLLDAAPEIEDLPASLLDRYSLPGGREALEQIHFPKDSAALTAACRRVQFERALFYFLFLGAHRRRDAAANGRSLPSGGLREPFLSSLGYTLTDAQLRALDAVEKDMASPVPMNRLIQGDVGCGKTVIAEYAAWIAAQNGVQCAFMAPTELLARQQCETLQKRFGTSCGLLTGSLDAASRRTALACLSSGEWSVVVGTHALFSEDVRYKDLGLVITDEQHRFGVEQRAELMEKGVRPDVLVMSATPIPRTLSLMLYGDLDVSAVNEMPPGRLPIKTYLVGLSKRKDMYAYLEKEAGAGRRSYVVCPLIEKPEEGDLPAAEEVFAELKELMPSASVGLLHGRMKEREKAECMQRFKTGEINVLVSTTVIEVGIHVPEAVHMVIEGAEQFGLSSLHQLRGRVGRGREQGHCYLSVRRAKPAAMKRLEVLVSTSDGFEVAEKDLQLRGAGDLLGVRQSGEEESFRVLKDCGYEVLETAHEAAASVLEAGTEESLYLMELSEKMYRHGKIIFN